MAPIPVDNNLVAETDQNPKPDSGYWTKANIALTAVFALIFLAICLASLVFWLHRRNEKKKLDNRVLSELKKGGGYLGGFEGVPEDAEFYLKDNAVVLYFQLYEYTAYAYGFPEFELKLKEWK